MSTVLNPHMFDSVIGKGCGARKMSYTWRDVALYALAVGAKKDDISYIYELGGLKALPTFGLLPYLNSILMEPQHIVPYAPNEITGDLIIEKLGGKIPNRLHMAMDLTMYSVISPIQGTFLTEDKVINVYDWPPKGIVNETEMSMYDLAGNPVCTCKSTHFHGAFGGFGGQPYQSPSMAYPDRAPDLMVTDHMADNQAALYRLLGDTYNVHIDTAVAKSYGYQGPFMQGLCTYGFACRMLIQKLFPYQPERMTHMYAQIRSICYPGQDITLQGWKVDDGKVFFKLIGEEGKSLLNNGLFEYRSAD